MDITTQELFLRLFLAAVLGGIIGYEREITNRPAGFRTHILVSVGSALIMLVSAYGFGGWAGAGFTVDRSRIAAQVVTGIGFLGAGTILRQGNTVRGLTTAASLWVVSGVGLAIGIGFYLGGLIAAGMVLVSLLLLGSLEKRVYRKRCFRNLSLRALDQPGLLGHIGSITGEMQININKVNLSKPEFTEAYGADVITIDFLLKVPVPFDEKQFLSRLTELKGILEFSWEGEEHRCRVS